jgi:hypothetical protein
VLPSGDVFVLLKNKSTSSKFQMYAEPRQVTVFASSDKRIIRGSYGYNAKTISGYSALTRLSHVSDGSVRGKQDIQKVVASAECDVAYVLMKFQLCGRLHTFSMIQPEYFCGGGLPESELYESRGFSFDDAVDAEAYLQTLDLDVGEVSTMLGQGPVLPNGQRWRDGGVWRIMRVR